MMLRSFRGVELAEGLKRRWADIVFDLVNRRHWREVGLGTVEGEDDAAWCTPEIGTAAMERSVSVPYLGHGAPESDPCCGGDLRDRRIVKCHERRANPVWATGHIPVTGKATVVELHDQVMPCDLSVFPRTAGEGCPVGVPSAAAIAFVVGATGAPKFARPKPFPSSCTLIDIDPVKGSRREPVALANPPSSRDELATAPNKTVATSAALQRARTKMSEIATGPELDLGDAA